MKRNQKHTAKWIAGLLVFILIAVSSLTPAFADSPASDSH